MNINCDYSNKQCGLRANKSLPLRALLSGPLGGGGGLVHLERNQYVCAGCLLITPRDVQESLGSVARYGVPFGLLLYFHNIS